MTSEVAGEGSISKVPAEETLPGVVVGESIMEMVAEVAADGLINEASAEERSGRVVEGV